MRFNLCRTVVNGRRVKTTKTVPVNVSIGRNAAGQTEVYPFTNDNDLAVLPLQLIDVQMGTDAMFCKGIVQVRVDPPTWVYEEWVLSEATSARPILPATSVQQRREGPTPSGG